MKKRLPIFVTLILTFALFQAKAAGITDNMQQNSFKKSAHSSEEIQMQKIAFYSQELKLSQEEAQIFWPIYNEYWEACGKARTMTLRSLNALNKATGPESTATDAEIERLTNEYFANHKTESELPAKYFEKFKKILPIKKAARIFHTEEKFRRMLIKQFRNKPTQTPQSK